MKARNILSTFIGEKNMKLIGYSLPLLVILTIIILSPSTSSASSKEILKSNDIENNLFYETANEITIPQSYDESNKLFDSSQNNEDNQLLDETEETDASFENEDTSFEEENSDSQDTEQNNNTDSTKEETSEQDLDKLEEKEDSDELHNPNIEHENDPQNLEEEIESNIEEEIEEIVDSTNEEAIEDTPSKINTASSKEFKRGDVSEEVTTLKHNLAKLGFVVSNNPNSVYGPTTERVVREFQKYYGLKPTGIADQETINLLNRILDSNFQKGKVHEDVIQLKKDLAKVGFKVSDNPNEVYGPTTEKVVKDFQSFYNLVVNGIADPTTLNKINELLTTPMQYGDYRKDVIDLKKKLAKLGFVVSQNPTPQFGPATEAKVKEFQEYYGLTVSGKADAQTLNMIDNILASPYQIGKNHEDVIELKKNLAKLGFVVSNNPNTIYGPTTEKVVKEFQRYHNLVVNGIVDQPTLDKINELLSEVDYTPLKRGDNKEEVRKMKLKLDELGFVVSDNPNTVFGPTTEKTVREFQEYYGLNVTGIADIITLAKIDSILNSPFRIGRHHEDTIKLKNNLSKLGFHITNNPSTHYGPATENTVRRFQEFYGLRVNGIADDRTLDKINEILNSPLRYGQHHPHVIKLKQDLSKLGFHITNNPSTHYGPATKKAVREFQRKYNLPVSGIADEVTLDKIQELLSSHKYTYYDITLAKALELQMLVNPQTDQHYAYVSKKHVVNGVTTLEVNIRIGPGTDNEKFKVIGKLPKGTTLKIIGESNNFYIIEYNHRTWVNARKSDVLYYLNPENFINDNIQKFQFLDLSRVSGATKAELNKFLNGKGTLHNQGQAFIDAGILHGINEIYLIAHAIHETGHGNSKLAQGIEVGKDLSGNLQVVNDNNRNKLTDIKKTYNMFGIGAIDKDPDRYGAIRAYQEGWFTPEAAIIGGAKFITKDYIKIGQNTLYKMRWNPQGMVNNGRATHQYATDIGWAYKQVRNIYNLYQEIGINTYYLDIPVYA